MMEYLISSYVARYSRKSILSLMSCILFIINQIKIFIARSIDKHFCEKIQYYSTNHRTSFERKIILQSKRSKTGFSKNKLPFYRWNFLFACTNILLRAYEAAIPILYKGKIMVIRLSAWTFSLPGSSTALPLCCPSFIVSYPYDILFTSPLSSRLFLGDGPVSHRNRHPFLFLEERTSVARWNS